MTEERFKELTRAEMSPEQAKLVDALLSGPRGGMRGPFKALLRSPELGDRVQKVGEYVRFHSSIPPALNEIAILLTGRKWNAQYEFYAHSELARKAGVSPAVIDAIAVGQRPEGMSADEAIVHDFAHELLHTTAVSDATYARAKDRFGERGVIDIVGAVGYYGMVSLLLNVDRVGLPAGEAAPLKAL